MCQSSSIILRDEKDIQVSWCRSSKKFTLIHRITHVSLSTKELSCFMEGLRNLGDDEYSYLVSGEPRVVLIPLHSKVGLCLTKTEVGELIRLINGARDLFEAFKPIYDR